MIAGVIEMNGTGNKTTLDKLTREGIYRPSGLTDSGEELEDIFGNPYIDRKKEMEEIKNAIDNMKSADRLQQKSSVYSTKFWHFTQSTLEIALNTSYSMTSLPGLHTPGYSRKIASDLEFCTIYKKVMLSGESSCKSQQRVLDDRKQQDKNPVLDRYR